MNWFWFRFLKPVLNNHGLGFIDLAKKLVLVFKTGYVLLKVAVVGKISVIEEMGDKNRGVEQRFEIAVILG